MSSSNNSWEPANRQSVYPISYFMDIFTDCAMLAVTNKKYNAFSDKKLYN